MKNAATVAVCDATMPNSIAEAGDQKIKIIDQHLEQASPLLSDA